MMFAYSLPIALIFTYALREHIEPWFDRSAPNFLRERKFFFLLLVVPFLIFSSLYLSLGKAAFIIQRPDIYFYPASLVEAIDWLEENAAWNEVLLSSPETGQLAAARTGRKVFIGHDAETFGYLDKYNQVEGFFQGTLSITELKPSNVVWIIYGPYEKALGEDFSPGTNVEIVFENQTVIIYKVSQ
jgi:hypothetical protein